MVGDMFNNSLQSKLDAVCTELAAYLAQTPSTDRDRGRDVGEVSYRSMQQEPAWWPVNLGTPAAVGTQNNLRYALFPAARRWQSLPPHHEATEKRGVFFACWKANFCRETRFAIFTGVSLTT
jgi:hypothetical protein